jgi:hypothetical protein
LNDQIQNYLAESFRPEDILAVLSPKELAGLEAVVLSVCGAGFGIAAVLSETRESFFIELVSVVSFLEQLMMNKTLIVKNNFFINFISWY